jgi:hypothetical protein
MAMNVLKPKEYRYLRNVNDVPAAVPYHSARYTYPVAQR